MTRAIARLQFDIETFARPRPDQLNEPARPSNTGNRKGRGRQRRDPPAGHRRRRLPEIARLRLPPPAAQRDADRRRTFRGQMQPPRGGHRQARDVTDDRPSPPCRSPSSIQARVALSSPASTKITRPGGNPACSSPGAKRSWSATHQSTWPAVRAAIPAVKQAAAAPSTARCRLRRLHGGIRAPVRHRAACDPAARSRRAAPRADARHRLRAARCAPEVRQWLGCRHGWAYEDGVSGALHWSILLLCSLFVLLWVESQSRPSRK